MKKIFILLAFLAFGCKANETSDLKPEPSLEQMIGQMIMIGFRGMDINEVSNSVKTDLMENKIGGIVLFDYDVVKKKAVRNIEGPDQLRKLISDLQKLCDTPLFMAVDQEGGKVNRLKTKYGFPKTVSNKYLGEMNKVDSTKFYAKQNAKLLSGLGFNVNFAPVVDLEINSENPVIGKIERSYSDDVEVVTKHAGIWIDEHHEEGIISVVKHFPGHGSSDSDSHLGVTDITKYWSEKELRPFKNLSVKNNVGVMTAHVLNQSLDSVPATLSSKIIKGILRDKWKFDGLLFSDDLHMAAVNEMYDFKAILKMSIDAGVDILVYGNNLKYDEGIPSKVIKTVSEMVQNGELSEARIQESYDRIMREKRGLKG